MDGSEDLFKGWHEFYVLMGTAAGTLVGLTFVAASNGTRIFGEKDRPALSIFLGPTVVHFTAITLVSILALIPTHQWYTFALLFGAAGCLGLPYALRVLYAMMARRYEIDWLDRFFYTFLPPIGYAMMLVATLLLYTRSGWGLTAAAAALVLLLLAGIRNAWDMTLWIVLKAPGESAVHKKKRR
jgi:hypothetical protein